MNRRNGPVSRRLIELFNALQRRETTFGQIYVLAASCGIDARRVLADKFSSTPSFALSWSGRRIASIDDYFRLDTSCGCKEASPSCAPSERSRHGLVRTSRIELFQQSHPVYTVDANEQLRHCCGGKPDLNIYRCSLTQLLIMATMVKPMISPLPKLFSALFHSLQSLTNCFHTPLCLLNTYTWKWILSNLAEPSLSRLGDPIMKQQSEVKVCAKPSTENENVSRHEGGQT